MTPPISEVTDYRDLRVYIAGKWEARERLRDVRLVLQLEGYKVSSSWLDCSLSVPYQIEDGPREAPVDLAEIDACNLFILDTLDENATGGANVEFGYALAGSANRGLWVVGPQRNIFHVMTSVRFKGWDDALRVMASEWVKTGLGARGTRVC